MATMAIAKRHKKNERAVKLAKALDEKEKEIATWFENYDLDKSNSIDRNEMQSLLTAVKRDASNDPQAEPVEDSILDLVLKKYASDDGRIGREKILNAVKAFKSYIAQELTYKDLFSKYDADGNGTLTATELLPLLQEIAPPPYKKATEGDAKFVMDKCDSDRSGNISFDELRPAITTWMELAKEIPPEPEEPAAKPASSSLCLIL